MKSKLNQPYYENDLGIIYNGDSLEILQKLPSEFVQTVITSPPYWNLRDYQVEGQIGLEKTIDEYIFKLVDVFKEIKRVLKKDGTLWLNLGDCYCSSSKGIGSNHGKAIYDDKQIKKTDWSLINLKPKDLCGIPWRVAFALQDDGWYLRLDIIYHKLNPLPEPIKDRPTKAHEYLFLMSKSAKYYYDWKAIKEPASPNTHARYARGRSNDHKYSNGGPNNQTIAKSFDHMLGVNPKALKIPKQDLLGKRYKQNPSFLSYICDKLEYRNKRSVWSISTQSFSEMHFATFPEKLVEPCVLAGSKKEDIILDPFSGSCTVAVVAQKAGRKWIMIDLNKDYCEMGKKKIIKQARQRCLF